MLSLIVAMDKNRLIGNNNQLPWHLSADLKRFKQITMGKPIIMGRKTHESIGRALPGRDNIIITHNSAYQAAGCQIASSIKEAIKITENHDEAVIIGGVTIYQQALPLVERLYLTLIDAEFEGDAWFPEYDTSQWRENSQELIENDTSVKFTYKFINLDRNEQP